MTHDISWYHQQYAARYMGVTLENGLPAPMLVQSKHAAVPRRYPFLVQINEPCNGAAARAGLLLQPRAILSLQFHVPIIHVPADDRAGLVMADAASPSNGLFVPLSGRPPP